MLLRMPKKRRKKSDSVPKLITQPWGWWLAFAEQAKRDGAKSLAEWIGDNLRAGLDQDLRDGIQPKERPVWGKDKQSD